MEALEACLDPLSYPWRVQFERSDERLWSSIAIPLFALALLAVSDRLRWPDPEEIHRVNNEMYAPD